MPDNEQTKLRPEQVVLYITSFISLLTALLGAILLTGFLGGTVATHLRVGNPLFTHVLFGEDNSFKALVTGLYGDRQYSFNRLKTSIEG